MYKLLSKTLIFKRLTNDQFKNEKIMKNFLKSQSTELSSKNNQILLYFSWKFYIYIEDENWILKRMNYWFNIHQKRKDFYASSMMWVNINDLLFTLVRFKNVIDHERRLWLKFVLNILRIKSTFLSFVILLWMIEINII